MFYSEIINSKCILSLKKKKNKGHDVKIKLLCILLVNFKITTSKMRHPIYSPMPTYIHII